MHKFLFYNKFLNASTCFEHYVLEHYVLIIRRSKLYYTASGIITPVGGSPVHRLKEDCFHCALSWLITKIILRCTVRKT